MVGEDVTTNCTTDEPEDDVDKTLAWAGWGTWVRIKVWEEEDEFWLIFVTVGMMTVEVVSLGAIAIGLDDCVTYVALHGKVSTERIGNIFVTGVTLVATKGMVDSRQFVCDTGICSVFTIIGNISSGILCFLTVGDSDNGLLGGALTITDTGIPVTWGTGVDGGVFVRSNCKIRKKKILNSFKKLQYITAFTIYIKINKIISN